MDYSRMRHGRQLRHLSYPCSQGTFVRVWTKHNVLSRAEFCGNNQKRFFHSKQRVRRYLAGPKNARIFVEIRNAPEIIICLLLVWSPKKMGGPIYRFLTSSDLVILRPTSNIFVLSQPPFSRGKLLLVLGKGTHLLLYPLRGAKFSSLTCHPASSETQHPARFQVKKKVHPSKKKRKNG